ncbi:MAG TPA: polyprenyl synthetase family protein [Patescibacteria group bacterium]|jgi:geranylgeranyl diphosphate synthase type I|nr:polyprenyl synthetase family protein [Patescibacteria group bacterium]
MKTTTNQLQQLKDYKKLIDQDLSDYSLALLEQTKVEYGIFARDALEVYCSVLGRGGKRLRGALVMSTYEMFGGKDQQSALVAARAIEMIHAYLLLIDDIADRSDLRRGGPTAHVLFKQYHDENQLAGDTNHFGQSMAMTVAMLGAHLAELEIDSIEVPSDTKLAIIRSLHSNLIKTIHGQLQDIYNEVAPDITGGDAERVATLKTAYYSFVNPMEIGALLAGAGEASLAVLRDFGMHAGLAFQLMDDVKGLFDTEAETGKLAMDDIKEGKMTIIMIKTLQAASESERQHLKASLGNQNLTESDFKKCLEIIKSAGALDNVKKLAHNHIIKAIRVLDNSPSTWKVAQVEFLRYLARSIVES